MKSYLFLIIFWLISLIAPGKQTISEKKVQAPPVAKKEITVALNPVAQVKAEMPVTPQELIIPALNMDAKILPVDLNSENLVDVPSHDVGWYMRGAKPGMVGNAVLQGHFKNFDLTPGIFNRISELQSGDDIYTVDSAGKKYHYKVTVNDLIAADDFPVEKIYGSADTANLILITCAGAYDQQKQDYLQRTIIYARLAAD